MRTASTALSASRWSPLLATITGSTTRLREAECASTAAATASTIAAVASMPVLTASQPRSLDDGVDLGHDARRPATTWTPVTPTVFCAVSAVMAEVP